MKNMLEWLNPFSPKNQRPHLDVLNVWASDSAQLS